MKITAQESYVQDSDNLIVEIKLPLKIVNKIIRKLQNLPFVQSADLIFALKNGAEQYIKALSEQKQKEAQQATAVQAEEKIEAPKPEFAATKVE